jgi:hypothetical protein
MSFRENRVPEAEAPQAAPVPVVLPTKQCYSDGLCNVCQKALADHPPVDGVVKDCNGWPLEFIDEKQSVVLAREAEAKAKLEAEKKP